MATRYAGKYRRSPYPQATRIKTFNFLWYLSLGGKFGHPPTTNFRSLLGGHVPPIPPTLHTACTWVRCTYQVTILSSANSRHAAV